MQKEILEQSLAQLGWIIDAPGGYKIIDALVDEKLRRDLGGTAKTQYLLQGWRFLRWFYSQPYGTDIDYAFEDWAKKQDVPLAERKDVLTAVRWLFREHAKKTHALLREI